MLYDSKDLIPQLRCLVCTNIVPRVYNGVQHT